MMSLQILAVFLLSYLTLSAMAQHQGEMNSDESVHNDILYPSSHIDGLLDAYSESPQLTRIARQYRHRPILAGAAAGVIVANNRRPTYYAPSYYYPSSGYGSNGCNCNG